MTKPHKVAIIGAGISGLSCATALQNSGLQVILYEKSRGVSGRLSTRVYEHWQCDHGAQYFTARDPLFTAEVQRWIKADVAKLWEPELKVFDGENFTQKNNKKDSNTLRYVGYPRNHSPAKWLAESLNVVTEAAITAIAKIGSQWQLTSKEHGVHAEHFDFVILCIPSQQAGILLKDCGSRLATLCDAVVMRPCFALMLHLDNQVNCQFDALFINSGLLSWVARDSSKPGRNGRQNNKGETWVLHASAEWSQANIDISKEVVTQKMLSEFNKVLQSDTTLTASTQLDIKLKEHDLHRWMYADCEHYLTDIYHFDAEHNIGLCGDWINGGKIQGAWLSGYKLAERIIDSTD